MTTTLKHEHDSKTWILLDECRGYKLKVYRGKIILLEEFLI